VLDANPAEQLSVSDAGNRPRFSRATDRKASAATSSDDISLTDNPPPASKDTHDRHLAPVAARVASSGYGRSASENSGAATTW
jgi:hypothetical protein